MSHIRKDSLVQCTYLNWFAIKGEKSAEGAEANPADAPPSDAPPADATAAPAAPEGLK